MSDVNTARPAGISYTDGDRQRVHRAFSDALDRLAGRSQPLNGWEGGQMLRALAAMATDAYSIAEGSIHAALARTPRGLDSPSQDEPVTVEGLRAGFLATIADARQIRNATSQARVIVVEAPDDVIGIRRI